MSNKGVLVELNGNRYRAYNYGWSIEDKLTPLTKATVHKLNRLKDIHGPSGADPDPDMTLAIEAVKTLGAAIIKRDGPTPASNYETSRVY